ncbi:MAG: protein kinase [Pseudonocardiaceae bacterium]|nr:protein kinase [Pseudonocardiaceae bacterium]
MGVVWRAEDQVIGRHVAVKELRVAGEGSADDAAVFTERVMREVRTGGRLNDPAVVTVYDVIAEAGATYIVMELVPAPTLSDLVRQRGPLPPEQVAAIGEQVLSALQAAHQAGVVHRDVKPGNVLVLDNGRVKLTDFGIAQAVDDPRLTTSGILVGSPAFMSPERVQGAEATPAADLWALGATLFFAVEGTVAFERSTTAATLHAIINEVPYLTRCGGPLASAISGLLIGSPEARLSAAQARGLLQLAANQPPPPSANANPQQTALYQGQPHAQLASPQPAPARRPGRPLIIAGSVLGVALLVGGVFLGNWLFSPGAPSSAMDETLTFGDGGQIPRFSYSDSYQGDCFTGQLTEGRRVDSSSQTDDCDDVHDFEVFYASGTLDVPDAGDTFPNPDYPGEDALARYGESWCAMYFHSNQVSWRNKETELRFRALIPTEASWKAKAADSDSGGSHNVYCAAYRADGNQFEGSVLASTE